MNATDDRPRVASASEITARGKGPVARAEASADSFYAAFESVIDKLESRSSNHKDRKKVHYGDKRPVSVAEATASSSTHYSRPHRHFAERSRAGRVRRPGTRVRTKDHPAEPMTIDDASRWNWSDTTSFSSMMREPDKPSVVYRRHAFDYGLIRLT